MQLGVGVGVSVGQAGPAVRAVGRSLRHRRATGRAADHWPSMDQWSEAAWREQAALVLATQDLDEGALLSPDSCMAGFARLLPRPQP